MEFMVKRTWTTEMDSWMDVAQNCLFVGGHLAESWDIKVHLPHTSIFPGLLVLGLHAPCWITRWWQFDPDLI